MYPKRLKVLPEPTEEVAEKLWLKYGCDKKKREEIFNVLKDWLYLQPHLPKNIDESKYLKTYAWCKNSLERTKDTIDMYYTLRAALPELYANRDPTSERVQKAVSLCAYIPLPRLTEKYERICVMRGMVSDLSELDPEDAVKVVLMVTDIRAKYDSTAGDIYIVDFSNITPSILAKFTPALLKKVAVICFKGFSARIKGIHLVNTPGYIDAFVGLIRAVFNKPKVRERVVTRMNHGVRMEHWWNELAGETGVPGENPPLRRFVHHKSHMRSPGLICITIHVHSKGLDSLHSFVDKKYLPKELGGDVGTYQELWDGWKETLLEFRDWFLEQENVKADESKRPLKAFNSNDLFGFEGSFRQLSMD